MSALKVIKSLFALDCVVTVIGWLSVVHINEIYLCCTEMQGDPETTNVFEMKKHFKTKRKGITNPGTFIGHENSC